MNYMIDGIYYKIIDKILKYLCCNSYCNIGRSFSSKKALVKYIIESDLPGWQIYIHNKSGWRELVLVPTKELVLNSSQFIEVEALEK